MSYIPTDPKIQCAVCVRYAKFDDVIKCYTKDFFILGGEVDKPTKISYKKTAFLYICHECAGVTNKECKEGNFIYTLKKT